MSDRVSVVPGERFGRRFLLAAFLVMAAGASLRVAGIGDRLVWHDEVYTRLFAAGVQSRDWIEPFYSGRVMDVEEVRSIQRLDGSASLSDTLSGLARDEPQHPPLYYLVAGMWIRWLGDDIATLRLLSALVGLLLLPAMFLLCLEMTGSARTALIGMALVAVSPFFVLYSQEAREYSFWAVIAVLSFLTLLRALRLAEPATVPRLVAAWAPYVLLTAAGLYTTISHASVIFAQVAFVLLRERLHVTRAGACFAVALLAGAALFAPWAMALLDNWEALEISMAWSEVIVVPRSELLATLALNASRTIVDFQPEVVGQWTAVAVGGALVLTLWSVASLRPRRREFTLIAALILFPIAILIVPDLAFGGIRSVSARYLTPAWIGVLLALASHLGRMAGGGMAGTALVAMVLAAGLVSSSLDSGIDAPWTKGVSVRLPEVAAAIGESPSPLVIGDRERHNPGNLLALSLLLRPGTRMMFVAPGQNHALPSPAGDVFLFTPTDPFRRALEEREHARTKLVIDDLHLQLWRVER